MNYLNKDFYDYILKIDDTYNSLHDVYEKAKDLLVKEGLDKELSDDAKETFFKILDIRRYKYREQNFYELDNALSFDASFRRVQKDERGNYMIYPSLKEFPDQNDLMMFYSLKQKMSVEEIIEYLKPAIEEKKEQLKKVEIEPYYGTPNYMILRTKAICDAINLLKNRDDIEDKDFVTQEFAYVQNLLNQMLNITSLEANDEVFMDLLKPNKKLSINKYNYDIIRKLYVEALKCESALIDVSSKLWENYEKSNNGVFIHQLTSELVESDRMNKICVSFYSDTANVITSYSGGETGYAYPMDISKTFCVCDTDVGSWRVSKEDYIDRGLPEKWQLDGSGLWYEYPYHTRLFSPEYIENKVVEQNHFAEIIIDNSKEKLKPLYCFYTSQATPEQIEKITSLANLQGLEIKHLKTQKDEVRNMQV